MTLPRIIDAGKKYCEKHNIEYHAETVVIGKKRIDQPCPQCITDSVELKERERIETLKAESQRKVSDIFRRSGIPPRYTTRTFENFNCKTDKQRKALNSAIEYSRNISGKLETGAGLILSGRPGTGKTHLACAIGCEYAQRGTVFFTTVTAMIRKIRTTYRKETRQTEQDVIDIYRDIDLLIIDEIGVQKGSNSEEHLLFEIINERYSYFRPTILISNLNAEEIKNYIGERALDRMREGGGKFIAFDWDSYRGDVVNDSSLPTLSDAKYSRDNVSTLRPSSVNVT